MTELPEGEERHDPVKNPQGAAPAGEPHAERADPIARVAKVRCLDQVKARGFTFAKGKVVEGVPLSHAEYLAAGMKAEILEFS